MVNQWYDVLQLYAKDDKIERQDHVTVIVVT